MTVTLGIMFCNAAAITVALHVYTTTTISRSSTDNTDSDRPLSDTVTVDALRACSMDVRYGTVAVTRRDERHCRQPRQTASMYYQLTTAFDAVCEPK